MNLKIACLLRSLLSQEKTFMIFKTFRNFPPRLTEVFLKEQLNFSESPDFNQNKGNQIETALCDQNILRYLIKTVLDNSYNSYLT